MDWNRICLTTTLMTLCKTTETPLLMHWSYSSLVLSHLYKLTQSDQVFEVPTFQGRGLLQWMLSSFSWVEQNLLSDDLPYSNWPPLHEPSAAVQGALHWKQHKAYIDGLVQERRNSSALAIDMLSSRTYDMIVFLKSSQKDTPLAHEGKAWSVLSIY